MSPGEREEREEEGREMAREGVERQRRDGKSNCYSKLTKKGTHTNCAYFWDLTSP